LYENPNISSYLLATLALIIRNILSLILKLFSTTLSASLSADKTALAEGSDC
jgi:hypothetical protein